MLTRTIILVPFLYFLALIQSSFLPHFAVFGYTFNSVLILIIFLAFFLPAGRQVAPSWSIISAFWGGFFLDSFSTHFFGFNILFLLGINFFIKLVLKRYVQIPIK